MFPDPADEQDIRERLAAPGRRRRRRIPFLGESIPGGAPAVTFGKKKPACDQQAGVCPGDGASPTGVGEKGIPHEQRTTISE